MSNEELVSLIQQGHDLMGELYMQNRHFIRKCAKVYEIYLNGIDDLMQAAYFGLQKAVDNFDPSQGNKFLTYAKYQIIQEIRREANRQRGIPDRVVTLLCKYKELKTGKNLTDMQIAQIMGITIKELESVKKYRSRILSIDKPIEEGSDTTLANVLPDTRAREDYEQIIEDLADKQNVGIILSELRKIGEKQHNIVANHHLANMSLKEIGEQLGLSPERIRQIENTAFRRIKCVPIIRKMAEEYTEGLANYYRYKSIKAFHNTGYSVVEDIVERKERHMDEYMQMLAEREKLNKNKGRVRI